MIASDGHDREATHRDQRYAGRAVVVVVMVDATGRPVTRCLMHDHVLLDDPRWAMVIPVATPVAWPPVVPVAPIVVLVVVMMTMVAIASMSVAVGERWRRECQGQADSH
ncbi:hypothetical protein L861_23965 [Litchfieldella anticariensis FP35 = DSM 16096]|uniref:Transmembrane protein n=1 Tax=Litchfieldella anticariensis (strain DSM 16096 / CECT 5854 / CIP 108499 / LMG 22089 / FP35) TaxID=1121939 RepID=S2LDM8_LITA3|nr:hypothetical protein L861_23965 [Halomonas anticariensis FP35 = DSM 16096]